MRGNLNYVTVTCNCSKFKIFVLCTYVLVMCRLRPQTTQNGYKSTNKMCPVKYLLKSTLQYYTLVRSTDQAVKENQ